MSERDRSAALLHLVRQKKELNGEPVEKAQQGEKCRWLHVWNGDLILLDRIQSQVSVTKFRRFISCFRLFVSEKHQLNFLVNFQKSFNFPVRRIVLGSGFVWIRIDLG
jgi:hypothetical protein